MSTVLLLNNADVEKLLTIKDTIHALDEAYLELDKGQTANRPRTFTFSPTNQGRFVANTHEGLIRSKGIYDIRVVTHSRPDPSRDPDKVNYFHGALNCSLDLLYNINSGDLLAIIHDGYLQKMRVQATNAIAARVTWLGQVQRAWHLSVRAGRPAPPIESMRFVRRIKRLTFSAVTSKTEKHSSGRCDRSIRI